MSLTTQDKTYISSEIKREFQKNNNLLLAQMRKETEVIIERNAGILYDEFKNQAKLISELVSTRPSREEFGELTDDVRVLERKVALVAA